MLRAGCYHVRLKVSVNGQINESASKNNLFRYYDYPSTPWEVCANTLVSLAFFFFHLSLWGHCYGSHLSPLPSRSACKTCILSLGDQEPPVMALYVHVGECLSLYCLSAHLPHGTYQAMCCTWFQRGADPVLYLASSFPYGSLSPFLSHSFDTGPGGHCRRGSTSTVLLFYFAHPLTHMHTHTTTLLITDTGLLPWLIVFFVVINTLTLRLNLVSSPTSFLGCNLSRWAVMHIKWLQNYWLSLRKGALNSYL